jgi:TolA-binding protein
MKTLNTTILLLVGAIALLGGQTAKTEPHIDDQSESSPSVLPDHEKQIADLKSTVEQLQQKISEYETSAGETQEEPDPAMVLYEKAMQYQANGGRRWSYSGSNLAEHIATEHGIDREALERQSAEALVWIHSMMHDSPQMASSGHWEVRRFKICTKYGCRYENRRVWVNE